MKARRADFGTVAFEQRLHTPEGVGIEERGLFAWVDFVFVAYFAGVNNVGEEAV